jgi:hypothetical protein
VDEHRAAPAKPVALVTVGTVAGVFSLLLLAHRAVPGSPGSLLESVLPWLAAPITLLLIAAVVTRKLTVVAAALVPSVIWAVLFVPTLTDHAGGVSHDLRVAELNLGKSTPGASLPPIVADREFAALAPLEDTQQEAGAGFGFTWPSALPVVRPDHILDRGLTTRRSWVVRAPGSDHRAVVADFATGTASTDDSSSS